MSLENAFQKLNIKKNVEENTVDIGMEHDESVQGLLRPEDINHLEEAFADEESNESIVLSKLHSVQEAYGKYFNNLEEHDHVESFSVMAMEKLNTTKESVKRIMELYNNFDERKKHIADRLLEAKNSVKLSLITAIGTSAIVAGVVAPVIATGNNLDHLIGAAFMSAIAYTATSSYFDSKKKVKTLEANEKTPERAVLESIILAKGTSLEEKKEEE